MSRHLNILDRVQVEQPCATEWDAMRGNEQVRFCQHCAHQVHNLSALTRREALRLVAKSGGKLCVYYYRQPDGTPAVLQDKYNKLLRVPRRVSRAAASAFGALISLSAQVAAQSENAPPDANAPRAEVTQQQFEPLPIEPRRMMGGIVMIVRPSTPLIRAVTANDLTAVKKLLASGQVDVNALDRGTDVTALMEAVRQGNREIVSELLRAGANVNQRSADRATALMYLNDDATPELVRDLLSFGAKVNVRDDSKRTVLLAVADNVTPEVLRVLLEAGAKVNVRDEMGRTPLMLAMENDNESLVETIKALLEFGADARAVDENGGTVLHRLDGSATPEILRLLLNAGADPRARNQEGATPLVTLAGAEGGAETLAALIRAGADVDAADNEGTTPLINAALADATANLRVLLEAGAKPNLRDKEGTTALGYIDREEHPDAYNLLLQYGATE